LFDAVIGELEDILMDPAFTDLQASFFAAHVGLFEEGEENRLAYTPVFAEYTQRLESFMEGRLKERIPGFVMSQFLALLKYGGDGGGMRAPAPESRVSSTFHMAPHIHHPPPPPPPTQIPPGPGP
jgi:hypothetical protein